MNGVQRCDAWAERPELTSTFVLGDRPDSLAQPVRVMHDTPLIAKISIGWSPARGRTEEEEIEDEEPQPSRRGVEARCSGAKHLPSVRQCQDATHRVPIVRVVQEPRRHRRRLTRSR